MIKNIVFDLGNVLLSFNPEEFLLGYTDDLERINKFVSKVPRNKTWFQLDRGAFSMEEVKEIFFNRYPEEKDLLVPFFDHWMSMLTPIEENVRILKELKHDGYNIYILSNFIKEAFEHVKANIDFFSLLDGQVISGEEKVMKPEVAIYKILLRRYNLTPEECVFIDDIFGFLKPARKLGINTILFRRNTDLRAELRKYDVRI